MRAIGTLHVAAALLSVSGTAGMADEIILNGRPCNSICQSWMGVGKVKPEPVKPTVETAGPAAPSSTPIRPEAATVGAREGPPKPETADSTPSTPVGDQGAAAHGVQPRSSGPTDPPEHLKSPDPATIAAVRGVVMIESAEDREANRRQKEALRVMTTKRDGAVGDVKE